MFSQLNPLCLSELGSEFGGWLILEGDYPLEKVRGGVHDGELLRLFSGDGRRAVVVIKAFLDESGMHENAPVVCVAAYAADHERWKGFEIHWRKVLDNAGIQYFHANEKRCDPLRPVLADAMERFELTGFLCSTGHLDYKNNTGDKFRSTLGNAYAVCAFGSALAVCKWAQNERLVPVAFVIESGQPKVDFVERTLKTLMADDERIASVTVAKKTDFPELQTADFLSHCCGTYDRSWLEKLIGDGPGKASHAHITGQQFTQMSEQIRELFRQYRHQKNRLKKSKRHKTTES